MYPSRLGDRITCRQSRLWLDSARLGGDSDGGIAAYLTTPNTHTLTHSHNTHTLLSRYKDCVYCANSGVTFVLNL